MSILEFFFCPVFYILCIYFPPGLSTIQWLSETLSSGIKQTGREANHLPLPTAKFKNEWIHTATRTFAFMTSFAFMTWRATNSFYFSFFFAVYSVRE